ncbi:MAG TPA: FAD-dependent oxidoreductase [Hyphomicrobiaceae bacterium]|nr:FAD-dependent oxidoreductase [Hyphomicrobiaceae bacterium]
MTHVRIKDEATGTESDLAAHGVFTCVGLAPNTGLSRTLVPVDAGGRIVVDAAMRTPERGVCAAGNVRHGSPHRVTGAMGDGAAAAAAIDRYLSTGEWRA